MTIRSTVTRILIIILHIELCFCSAPATDVDQSKDTDVPTENDDAKKQKIVDKPSTTIPTIVVPSNVVTTDSSANTPADSTTNVIVITIGNTPNTPAANTATSPTDSSAPVTASTNTLAAPQNQPSLTPSSSDTPSVPVTDTKNPGQPATSTLTPTPTPTPSATTPQTDSSVAQPQQSQEQGINLIPHRYLGKIEEFRITLQLHSNNESEAKQLNSTLMFVAVRYVTCHWKRCFYGWVKHYLTPQGYYMQGYPLGNHTVKPIFFLEVNDQMDYRITRHKDMAEILVNIIERGCAQFNPTVMHDSSYDWKNLEGKLMNLKETTKTNNITLDGFDANDSKHTKNLVMNDKEGIVEKTSSKTNVVLAEEQLKDDKNRSTGFDKTCAESMHRHKTVEKDALMNSIMRQIANLRSKFNDTCYWTGQLIEKRHKSQAKPDKDSHPVVEDKDITLRNSPGRLLQEYDISKDNMAVTVPSKMILGRMLQQVDPSMNQIFNLTKTVFNKKCLGKEYSLAATTKVQVDKIYGYVRMIGNLRYVFFGKSFEKPLYDFIQKAGTSMTKQTESHIQWGFDIRLPLVPPLGFVSIVIGIELKVFLQTHLHAEGTNTPEGVHAQLTGTMSTGVTLTLSAGLAVLAVEVGVFMSGTMINISMISDASVDIVNKTRDMSVTLEVNQELRSLAFSWGFFVRFWFIRWSKRKILVTYPVFGGLVKRTPIFKQTWKGQLQAPAGGQVEKPPIVVKQIQAPHTQVQVTMATVVPAQKKAPVPPRRRPPPPPPPVAQSIKGAFQKFGLLFRRH